MVPAWIRRQKVRQMSVRLKKAERLEQTVTTTTFPVNDHRRWANGYSVHGEYVEKAFLPGNLPKAEYRYFTGTPYESGNYAKCRACEQSFYAEKDRQNHLGKKDSQGKTCQWMLQEAFNILKQDRNCIICDKRVKNQLWGVPLCKTAKCVGFFKYKNSEIPRALDDAIKLVKVRNGYPKK